MNSYLVPVVPVTIDNTQVSAPEYYDMDLAGVNFAAISYGLEPLAIVTTAAPNASLAAEGDVYAFPTDTTQTLADGDVTTLQAFLDAANIPSDQIVFGMTSADALAAIAQIFLLMQFVEAQIGSAIFAAPIVASPIPAGTGVGTSISAGGTGQPPPSPSVSLDTPVAQTGLAALLDGAIVTSSPGKTSSAAGLGTNSSGAPIFDLSAADPNGTIGDALDAISQTWAGGEIIYGGF